MYLLQCIYNARFEKMLYLKKKIMKVKVLKYLKVRLEAE